MGARNVVEHHPEPRAGINLLDRLFVEGFQVVDEHSGDTGVEFLFNRLVALGMAENNRDDPRRSNIQSPTRQPLYLSNTSARVEEY